MNNYLWDKYDGGKDFVAEKAPSCPSLENLGDRDKEGRCLINPLLRFARIFRPLYAGGGESELEENCRNLASNLIFHALARQDLLSGLTLARLEQAKILEKLESGYYGAEVGKSVASLDVERKELLAAILFRQEKERRTYFLEALKAFFPRARVYFYRDDHKILVYLPYEKTEENMRLLDIVEFLFCDLASAEREYYWTIPFGIIGEPATLELGNCVIY